PKAGVSAIQELQMQTQEGKNVDVCAIEGDFDDAQTGVKKLFVDKAFTKNLQEKGVELSSANSINIGRLIPQIVYYFYAYASLVKKGEITTGEQVNFVVPTGNFGNILAGYYAKQLGLPVHKLICASNENHVLFDFMQTGIYDRKRALCKTDSPSMDILVSSNLERLLYDISGEDNDYVKTLMKDLEEKGRYQVKKEMLEKIQEVFSYGYATNEETRQTVKQVWEKEGYLLDPHTAVAYKVMMEDKDQKHKNIVLATASPYKFASSVYEALGGQREEEEFAVMEKLAQKTGTRIPEGLKSLKTKSLLHQDCIKKEDMGQYVYEKITLIEGEEGR
ncbi:MAG: threonine synthase, partial [Clostridiales bacterium]|nr:threonine synthase [Clostridiales bacterium]